MKTFRYTVEGTAAGGQTWTVTGTVDVDNAITLWAYAMKEAFEQLTNGEAVYGQPGVGCNGPYDIRRAVIERVLQ